MTNLIMSISKLKDETENARCMVQFLNYAYNTPETERTRPMTDDEKIGGQEIFAYLDEQIKNINLGLTILEIPD